MTIRCSIALLLLVSSVGCGSATTSKARQSAAATADRLAALQSEIQKKVDEETSYYDSTVKILQESVRRTQYDDLDSQLEQLSRRYLSGLPIYLPPNSPPPNPTGPLQEIDADQLEAFMTQFLEVWSSIEQERQQQLAELENTLAQNRRQLDASSAQLAALQSKLRALAQARTKAELAEFAFSFFSQTASEIESLREPAGGSGTDDP